MQIGHIVTLIPMIHAHLILIETRSFYYISNQIINTYDLIFGQ